MNILTVQYVDIYIYVSWYPVKNLCSNSKDSNQFFQLSWLLHK